MVLENHGHGENKLIIQFMMDVSFQKDTSLHEETLIKTYINNKLH